MATAALVDPSRLRAAARRAKAQREARRTARHLRRLAAQVARSRNDGNAKHLAALLRNGAWAVEDVYGLHPREET